MKQNKFDILRKSIIIGFIDSYDAVHSYQYIIPDDGDMNIPVHSDLFGVQCSRRWRWDYNDCINYTGGNMQQDWTDTDFDSIRNHLTKNYGIKFWDNGYHDIDYFMSKMSKKK